MKICNRPVPHEVVCVLLALCCTSSAFAVSRRVSTRSSSGFGQDANYSFWHLGGGGQVTPFSPIPYSVDIICPFQDVSGGVCESGTYSYVYAIDGGSSGHSNLVLTFTGLTGFGYGDPGFAALTCDTGGTNSYSLCADGTNLEVKDALAQLTYDTPNNSLVIFVPRIPAGQRLAFILSKSFGDPNDGRQFPPRLAISDAALTPLKLSFGSQAAGTASEAQILTLTNGFATPLDITSIGAGSGFAVSHTCGQSLAPDSSCAITVISIPATASEYSGTLTVLDNGDLGGAAASLSGAGSNGAVTLDPGVLIFGTPAAGSVQPVMRSALLTNTTDHQFTIGTITVNPDPYTNNVEFIVLPSSTCTDGMVLDPGGSCSLDIGFPNTSEVGPPATGSAPHTGELSGAVDVTDLVSGDTYTLALRGFEASSLWVDTTTLSFGSQKIGTLSSPQVVTLGGIAISVNASADFVVTGETSVGTVSVAFSPTATGPRAGLITLGGYYADETQVVVVSGKGIIGNLRLSPPALNFGDQLLNMASAAQNVEVANEGTQVINLSSIVVGGDFIILGPGTTCSVGAPLGVGEKCTIAIAFTPATTGVQNQSLTITSDDIESPHATALTGRGISEGLPVLSVASLDFGDQFINTTSPPQIVTLTNDGATPLGIISIMTSGDFAQTNTCPGSLPVGKSCEISVTFTPGLEGLRAGVLAITHDAAGGPQSAGLLGNGIKRGPSHVWSKRFGGTDFDYRSALAVDSSGNVLVTGYFSGTVDFGGGPLTSAGFADIFVAKFAPDGTHLWSKRFGGIYIDGGFGVAVDSGGNVLVTGYFSDTVDFGGGPLTSAGSQNIFVAKFSSDGTHLWSKRFGGTSYDSGQALAVDSGGNILVTGYFNDTVDFGGGPLTNSGGLFTNDIFVAKFSPDGSHLWSKRFGSTDNEDAHALAVDSLGNVLVTGYFSGTVDFGGGPLTSAGDDVFVAKYSPDGDHLWSKRFGGTSYDSGQDLAVDSGGNVLVTGYFQDTVDFGGGPLTNAGESDGFIAKYSPDGSHLWSKRLGGAYSDIGNAVAVDSGGDVLVTGFFNDTVNFGGGPLTSAGDNDVFVAKYSPDGSHLWSKRFGGASSDAGNALAVDSGGNVVVTGSFWGTLDFGGGPLTSAGAYDIFVAKLGPAPSVSLNRTALDFGDALVGSTSPAQTIALANVGDADLNISDISFTGDFSRTTTCGSVLPVGANCQIGFSFTPTTNGARNGTLTVASDAPSSPRTLPLTGTGILAPAVSLSVTSITFGNQLVGTTSSVQTVTLTNNGTAPLTIDGVVKGGANPGDFALTNGCPGSLTAGGGTCSITATFTPTAVGARSATITITDNNNGVLGSMQVIALAGTGTAPGANLSPSNIGFGNQRVGTSSPSKTISVMNSGDASLTVTSVAANGDFAVASQHCTAGGIAAGTSCDVEVTFAPTARGARSGTLTIASDASGSPHTASLTGTGIAPVVSLSTASLDFTGQLVGTTSGTRLVTMGNSGDAALAITSITTSGDFTLSHDCPVAPSTLAVSGNCTLTAVFKPTAGGARNGEITIVDDASGSPRHIALAGTGTDFALNVQSGGTTSSTVTAGKTATYILQIEPTGFVGNVALGCAFQGSTPRGASCSVTPNVVALNGTDPGPFTVNVATTARSLSVPRGPELPPGATPSLRYILVFMLCVMMLTTVEASRPRAAPIRPLALRWASLGATLLFVLLWTSCGGGGGGGTPSTPQVGTPAGNYTLNLTAAAGGVTKTSSLALKVN